MLNTGPGAVVATVRQDQREGRERGQHRQGGARAMDLKSLFVMARAAPEQAQPDDAVAHDHDGGENRVACEPRLFRRRRTMTETISATSMTVTATARISVPNGSPVRWATTSA